jgi:hypothetical protein
MFYSSLSIAPLPVVETFLIDFHKDGTRESMESVYSPPVSRLGTTCLHDGSFIPRLLDEEGHKFIVSVRDQWWANALNGVLPSVDMALAGQCFMKRVEFRGEEYPPVPESDIALAESLKKVCEKGTTLLFRNSPR